jgi:hypothetical protein
VKVIKVQTHDHAVVKVIKVQTHDHAVAKVIKVQTHEDVVAKVIKAVAENHPIPNVVMDQTHQANQPQVKVVLPQNVLVDLQENLPLIRKVTHVVKANFKRLF